MKSLKHNIIDLLKWGEKNKIRWSKQKFTQSFTKDISIHEVINYMHDTFSNFQINNANNL